MLTELAGAHETGIGEALVDAADAFKSIKL